MVQRRSYGALEGVQGYFSVVSVCQSSAFRKKPFKLLLFKEISEKQHEEPGLTQVAV
jgi:hypothetical protein